FVGAPCSPRVRRIVLRPTPLRNHPAGAPSIVLERATSGGPLRVAVARAEHRKLGPLLAGLSPDQLDALAAGTSGFVLAAIDAARRAPPPRKRPPARAKQRAR